jgi:hypothetical protein
MFLPSRERARLILSVTTDSKLGVMFTAGAVMALRDLGLLSLVQVFCGTGQASVILNCLCDAFRCVPTKFYTDNSSNRVNRVEFAWRALLLPPTESEPDVLMHGFFHRVVQWCHCNQEFEMYHSRIRKCPLIWAHPWSCELGSLLQGHALDKSVFCARVSRVRPAEQSNHRPIFLWCAHEVGTSNSLVLTNDPNAPKCPALGVKFARPDDVTDCNTFIATCICDSNTSACVDVDIGSTRVALQSGLEVDPLGMRPANVYYIQEKLGPLPHMDDMKCDLSDHVEDGVSNKVILIDAFTDSPSYDNDYSVGVKARCKSDIDLLMSAPDSKHERPIAFHGQIVDMYNMNTYNHKETNSSFFDDIQMSSFENSGLCGCDRDLGYHAANLGYVQTLRTFATAVQMERLKSRHIQLCYQVDDSYGFYTHHFGSPPTRDNNPENT